MLRDHAPIFSDTKIYGPRELFDRIFFFLKVLGSIEIIGCFISCCMSGSALFFFYPKNDGFGNDNF